MREELGGEIERLEHQLAQAAGTEAELRQELIAARAQAEEADEQRHAARSSGAAPTMELRFPRRRHMDEPRGRAEILRRGLSATIADRDPTFGGDRHAYLEISRSALGVILPALAIAGIARPAAILDLPRLRRVTRALRAAWPEAELVAADQSTAAIAFCVEQFGARLDGWRLPGARSGRWPVGALRPDLDGIAAVLDRSRASGRLPGRVDGDATGRWVLVAAYHGRDSTRRFSENADKGCALWPDPSTPPASGSELARTRLSSARPR